MIIIIYIIASSWIIGQINNKIGEADEVKTYIGTQLSALNADDTKITGKRPAQEAV